MAHDAGVERERRVLHHRAGRRACRAHDVQHRQVFEAERHLQARLHVDVAVAVDQEAVDVGLAEARVVERESDGLGREVGGAPAVDLAHLGDPEADDGGVHD